MTFSSRIRVFDVWGPPTRRVIVTLWKSKEPPTIQWILLRKRIPSGRFEHEKFVYPPRLPTVIMSFTRSARWNQYDSTLLFAFMYSLNGDDRHQCIHSLIYRSDYFLRCGTIACGITRKVLLFYRSIIRKIGGQWYMRWQWKSERS